MFCCSTENKVNQRFNVLRPYKISCPCFVVRPIQTTEEGAIGGEKNPASASQEESKKCVIIYTWVFM